MTTMIGRKEVYTILASCIGLPAPAGRREQSTKQGTLSFPPIRAPRANLMETKTTFLKPPEERCRQNASQC